MPKGYGGYGGGYTTGTGQGIRRPYSYMQQYDPWADAAGEIAKALNTIAEDSATQDQRDRVFNRQIITSLANIDADMGAGQIDDRIATLTKMVEKEDDPMLKDYGQSLIGEMGGVKDIVINREAFELSFDQTEAALDALREQVLDKGDYSGASGAKDIFGQLYDSYSKNISDFSAAQRQLYNKALKQMDNESAILTALEMLDTDKDKRGVQLDPNKYTASSQALVDQAEFLTSTGQHAEAKRTMYQIGGVEARAAKQMDSIFRNNVTGVQRLNVDTYRTAPSEAHKQMLTNVHGISTSRLPLNVSPDVIGKQREEVAEAMMNIIDHEYPVNYPETVTTMDQHGDKTEHNMGDIMRAWKGGNLDSNSAMEQMMAAFNIRFEDGRVVMPGERGAIPVGGRSGDRKFTGSEWSREVSEDPWRMKAIQDMFELYIRLNQYEESLRVPRSSAGGQAALSGALSSSASGAGVSGWTSNP